MNKEKAILFIPRLYIQNANAISGPLTWGFPSPSAFVGFTHALNRNILGEYPDIIFKSVGIVCHRFLPQVTGDRYVKVFNLTRNPLDKEGKSPALVEEGRVHLDVSLVIEVEGYLYQDQEKTFIEMIEERIGSMRIAGGSILPFSKYRQLKIEWLKLPDDFKKFRRKLLPGFILLSRSDLLKSRLTALQQKVPDATLLDALLDLTRINFDQEVDAQDPDKAVWKPRHKQGWLVPLPVGYGAITPLYPSGMVVNARDNNVPVRFVEGLYSIGEWVSPHRLHDFAQLFWRYEFLPENEQYLCVNDYYKTLEK